MKAQHTWILILSCKNSFQIHFEEGAFSGAITGAITGAAFAGLGQLGAALGKGIKCASTLGKFVKGTAGSQWKSRVGTLDNYINEKAALLPGSTKLSELDIEFVLK